MPILYPILAPECQEVTRLCNRFGLTRVDQSPQQPHLIWHQPLRLVIDKQIIDMVKQHQKLRNHLLAKSLMQSPSLTIFDATAGLLSDSQICLALKHQVIACEQHPFLAAMIESFKNHFSLQTLTPLFGDAHHLLPLYSVDVVIIDPMFDDPKTTPKSKKGMQSIKQLVDRKPLDALLPLALKQASLKVMVKQHSTTEPWLPSKLNHQLKSKNHAFRWDIYIP
ncbi:MAG: class I SAM-dependent methyltransferase [Candidatus Comchoanobacterales bacterium]